MRKKFLNGKRVMALALAFSMVIGEMAFAAPAAGAETEVEATVSTNATETEETVETEVPVAAQETETPAEGETEALETEAEETEEIEAEEAAYDGTLSKVIGLKASPSFYALEDENGQTVVRYDYPATKPNITVAGKVEADPYSKLYTVEGKLYRYASYDKYMNITTIDPEDEVVVLPGSRADYLDAATDLYLVNGVYYSYLYSYKDAAGTQMSYCVPYSSVVLVAITTPSSIGDTEARKMLNQTYGVYVKSDAYYAQQGLDKYSQTPNYYAVGGKYYKGYLRMEGATNATSWYLSASSEIALNQEAIKLSWVSQTLPTNAKNAAGQELHIAYEIMLNGAVYMVGGISGYETNGTVHRMTTSTSEEISVLLAPGQSATAQVRALYYHTENKTVTEEGVTSGEDRYYIDSFGEWSDLYTYTCAARTAVSAVTGVTAAKVYGKDEICVKWNAVQEAYTYGVYEVASKKPLNINAAAFNEFYTKTTDASFLAANGLAAGDLSRKSYTSYYDPKVDMTYDDSYMYHYYAVVPRGVADDALFYNDQSLKSVQEVAAITTADTSLLSTPTVANFKVENKIDGGYNLTWTPVEQEVVIYAYDSSQFPAFYQYYKWGVQREFLAAGTTDVYLKEPLTYDLSAEDKTLLSRVKSKTVDGSKGRLDNAADYFSLQAGKTYYFVAYTFDTKKMDTEKKAPLTYTSVDNTTKNENGVLAPTTTTYSYEYYAAVSAPSAVVSAKTVISRPNVYTLAANNSIKLSMDTNNCTGYEIYRKVGKKFKKIVTTTDDVYTDEGLKTNTSYTYKVRAYSYNVDTKKKYYSEYRIVNVKTGTAANISLNVVKSGTTSVKLKWTKVSAATKYEIYRMNSFNGDPKVLSKKYSADGIAAELVNARYQLIKTVNKAKTTSYTDKNLVAGEDYTYVIVAYYKNGKTVEYVNASNTVSMQLEAPQNVKSVNKGSYVKLSWDKDSYAKNYEVQYTAYNKDGTPKTDLPITVSTKKTSYTIKGLSSGEYVVCQVRAYGKNKKYSAWSEKKDTKNLAAVTNIKAVNQTVNGKAAVKITWKKVAGAKYYKVYRSTTAGVYYADDKNYGVMGKAIAKESNDDYDQDADSLYDGDRTNSAEVSYKEYLGVTDSIVGTTAYDYADLSSGVKYYYCVVAYGDVPVGATNSRVYSNRTGKPASVVFNAAITVKLKNAKKGQVTVSYNKVSGATKYTIYRSEKKNGTYKAIGTSKKASYTDKKAKKGKTYYYKVVATGTNALKANLKSESGKVKIKVKK